MNTSDDFKEYSAYEDEWNNDVHDKQAISDYRCRLKQIAPEIKGLEARLAKEPNANQRTDLEKAIGNLQAEANSLNKCINESRANPNHPPRRDSDDCDVKRKAVGAAVKRARTNIGKKMPKLLLHLKHYIETGHELCYRPPISQKIRWDL